MPRVRTTIASLAAAAALWLPSTAAGVPIDIDGPTTGWTAISFASSPDWADDQATGQPEADIVGNLSHPAFYSAFDDAGTPALTDGVLGFRIRIGAQENPVGFNKIAAVGIDANRDGALDLYVMVRNSGGGGDQIAIFNPGATANTSPSTISITATGPTYTETLGLNYDWSPVSVSIDPSATVLDLDADGVVDRFLSFSVPFQDLVTRLAAVGVTGVDQNTPLQYVIGTSTNANTLNQDFGGPNGGVGSSSTWAALGATSLAYSAAGTPVPEPGTAFLLGLGLLGIGLRRRATPR